jgi:uncharacterized membrane protein HdeD (DUF308 family)
MFGIAVTRERTAFSFLLGALLVVIGLVILAHAATATEVSIRFLGWMLVLSGIAGLAAAVFGMRSGGAWSAAVGGGGCFVAGLMCLRHVDLAAVTLTLIIGAVLLLGGIVRLVFAAADDENRLALLLGGGMSAILGLVVLFNLFEASSTLLGFLLGIQTLVEGLSMVIVGRVTGISTPQSEKLTSI